MIEHYHQLASFKQSIESASGVALNIFILALLTVVAYRGLDRVPVRWRPFVKLTAWIYAVVVLVFTVYVSGGVQ